MKYIVYHGYVSPDNYDEYTTHKITVCKTKDEVLELHKEHLENIHEECSVVEFQVFEGKELKIKPKTVVETFDLEE